jgi:hypothetical protein
VGRARFHLLDDFREDLRVESALAANKEDEAISF